MGFYIRKSVRVGPLRFNLSKSGIGVSAGVPGFRVGMGPRGNYVHAGRGGIYYRATLSARRQPVFPKSPPRPATTAPPSSLGTHNTLGPSVEIDSGSVLEMQDESAAGLLAELNEKRARHRFGPATMGLSAVVVAYVFNQSGAAAQILAMTLAIVAIAGAFVADAMRKTTVLMYDLDADATASFQGLIDAVTTLGDAQRLWHVNSRAAVLDRKYHAGAQSEIQRSSTSVTVGSMPFVKCNVDVPKIAVGRQTLCFTPDRLLVFDSASVGAIAYVDLRVQQTVTRFIEPDGVPSDSRVVGRTWRYVNKGGGPDRRFSNNPEIPICEYASIHFCSGSGLNELLHSSKVGGADSLIRYLAIEGPRLSKAIAPFDAGGRTSTR